MMSSVRLRGVVRACADRSQCWMKHRRRLQGSCVRASLGVRRNDRVSIVRPDAEWIAQKGSALSFGEDLATTSLARTEISRTLETKVKNGIRDFREQLTDGESEMTPEQFSTTTVSLSKSTLTGTSVQKTLSLPGVLSEFARIEDRIEVCLDLDVVLRADGFEHLRNDDRFTHRGWGL